MNIFAPFYATVVSDGKVFQLFLIRPQNIGVFGLVLVCNDDFELSMPSYCLVVSCDDDFESSMPYIFPLPWLPIFSVHVPFLGASCALYFDPGIVLSRSMLRFCLTHSSRLFCLCGE